MKKMFMSCEHFMKIKNKCITLHAITFVSFIVPTLYQVICYSVHFNQSINQSINLQMGLTKPCFSICLVLS